MENIPFSKKYQRIATEEAWAPADMLNRWRKLLNDKSFNDPGFMALWGFFLEQNIGYTNGIIDKLQDLGSDRLADMDATGIDRQLLLLTAPGVQVFQDPAEALDVARASNDEVSEACNKHPDRFSALAAVPPQDPAAAAREMAILFCQQVMGVDNILYAMDYPYEFNREEVFATDGLPISPEDMKKLYQTNAQRVFNL